MARLPDVIMQFHDLAAEPQYRNASNKPGGPPTDYIGHLDYLFRIYHGEPLTPPPPAIDGVRRGITSTIDLFVNSGRWLWLCVACNSGIFVEDGYPSCCPVCFFEGWVNVAFPAERRGIEAELLRQPGRRSHAPIRIWKPGQTIGDLLARTNRAQTKIAAGERNLRSLSIGATRTWAVAEILTAANMNTFGSDIMDDLAGRNGEVQIEGPFKINDGAGQYFELPVLTTTQRDALTPANGMTIYNSSLGRLQARKAGAWISIATGTPGTDGHLAQYDATGDLVNQNQPVLGDFTNATHDHSDDSEGGSLPGLTITIAVSKTSDESVLNSTALQDDDELALALAANQTYIFTLYLTMVAASSTPDAKIGFTLPAGATMKWSVLSTASYEDNRTASDTAFLGLSTTQRDQIVMGTVEVGGTPGDLQFRFAQNTLDAGDSVTVKAGSTMSAIKAT